MPKAAAQLQFDTLAIEGGLFTAEWLGKVASFKAPGQSDADYGVRAGFSTREEIALAWRSAQHLWGQFKSARNQSGFDTWAVSQRFVTELLRQSFGFATLRSAEHPQEIDGRRYPVSHFAHGQAVPLVISVCTEPKPLDTAHDRLGDNSGERLRRRSAFGLLQEYVNAADDALWGIASNGLLLRIARDNGSLTRPAWLEADLERLFEEENQAEFSVLWLFLHASLFGAEGQASPLHRGEGPGARANPNDCILEQWRNGCRDQGIQARGLLRQNVEQALEDLGQGFVSHPANIALREALGNGNLSTREYFRHLLRLVYRLIFLLTVEERGILHPPDSLEIAKGLFERGYSLKRLRDRAVRRSAHDRHHDLWEGLKRVWLGLAEGEPRLALPALGGLFATSQCPAPDGARLENRHLLAALFHLAWLRDAPGGPLTRVNWRDMGSEELGSIYESLLELTPQLAHDNRHFSFLEGAATKGNARKTSGSYYTPDSLVQELLDSALEPVVVARLAPHGGALASGEAAAQALLAIAVIDPACGSGHFILAAARRLAAHLARVRTEGGQPTPDDYRHALRQVVTHCIYGVDLNPMAVELAKISLWLEAYTPDAPLGFIDHHIRCGDALLGVLDPAILDTGIPDKAFNALSGDDKDVVKALKKANRDALKAIEKARHNMRHMLSLALDPEAGTAALEALPDDTLAAIEAKRMAFAQAEAATAQSRARVAADLFVAAFVLPKTPANQDTAPTSQDLWLVMNGEAPRPGVSEGAAQAADSARALHWWQAFPQIRAKGGFDVLLGNPPWEVSQIGEEEYFAARAPSIAALAGEPRKRAIAALEYDNTALWDSYIRDCQKVAATNTFYRESGRFPLTAVGKLNTYPLFAETFSRLMAVNGRADFIVPSGIGTDDSNKRFFQFLVDNKRLVSFLGFDNARRIFPAVHSDTPFALITIGQSDGNSMLAHYILGIEQLVDPRRRFTLTSEDFCLINPNTRTCPVFRSQHDVLLTKKLYHSAPVLIAEDGIEANGWQVDIVQNFFSTSNKSDRTLFIPAKDADNFQDLFPVFRGTMIDQFDHHAATYSLATDSFVDIPTERKANVESRSDKYLPMADVQARLADKGWQRQWLMGWRDITNATNRRTLIATVLPVRGADDTLSLILPHVDNARLAACLLGNLNSLVLDYIAQIKVGGTHVRKYVISQLPIIPPEQYSEADLDLVFRRVLELTYTTNDLKPWAEDLGYDGPPFAFDPERRAVLRAELDACFARLYGLARDELRYILDPADVMGADYPSETFRALKNSEIKEFGEYRTARLVLREFDRTALADAAHEPCQSLLVPPPGQPSSPQYSSIGVLRDEDDARLAGLVMAIIRQAGALPRQHLMLALTAAHTPAVKTS
ncbi:MAG: N-6 DNA methylase, partial [Rhodocyclaceae bacterium]|nr:N-6 DNA methylase [Rhodocyclaceae bacterium]